MLNNLTKAIRLTPITYTDILSGKSSGLIEEALGLKGSGSILVKCDDEFLFLRRKVLNGINQLKALPKEEQVLLEDPDSGYRTGLNYGKIVSKSKGRVTKSFFNANCVSDNPTPVLNKNRWPKSLTDFKNDFIKLSTYFVQFTISVAKILDKHLQKEFPEIKFQSFEKTLKESDQHLGHLLNYYPQNTKTEISRWHNDHQMFTMVTCPMYFNAEDNALIDEDNIHLRSEFELKNRNGEILQLLVKNDEALFHVGETAQVMSGGLIQATPHAVITNGDRPNMYRNTLVVFTMPRSDFVMNSPLGDKAIIEHKEVFPLKKKWKQGINFQDYNENYLKFEQ
ncbi:hypothetical protein SteCoe_32577 [Stentor coeruleus]|uniref:Fe2OG dioxygenase domain-containing protein n=1 Tax=Stentor coeruleus TaxID=5963 RepID=A0A1R2AYW2_9CILI|nr:hypothetical protein SteCoe_32577 [Stentor coeruleus]